MGPFATDMVIHYREDFGAVEIPLGVMHALFERDEPSTVDALSDAELLEFMLMTVMQRNEQMIAAVRRGETLSILDVKPRPNRQQRRHGAR